MFKFIQTRRVLLDIVLYIALMAIFLTGLYEQLSNPIQLVILKMLLVSSGFLHAHITRKLAFAQVDWKAPIKEATASTVIAILLYAIIPLCYAFGG